MTASIDRQIEYPDSDGQPMSDNTKQFRWIVLIKENLEYLFADDPTVFVAGDLLWYPVEGHPEIRVAPDDLVAFGRPKGDGRRPVEDHRGSYRQWEEEDIAPQVVFEVLSPGNTLKEMTKKLFFYEQYGVQEYYVYDPDRDDFSGFQRSENRLLMIEEIQGWESPLLGIRFEPSTTELRIFHPDGKVFLTPLEIAQQADLNEKRMEQATARAEKLADKLKELGVDPDSI